MMTEQQEKQVKELFNQLPTAHTGSVEIGEIKMINYSLFLSMIDSVLYENSYVKGYIDGIKTVSDTTDRIIASTFANQ
jgi:hypothetical protein